MVENLLLTDAKIFGGSGWNMPSWSDSLLLMDGRIAAVGETEAIRNICNDAREIDLEGMLVLPGLCDAHLHMAVGGRSLQILDLDGRNREEIIRELTVLRDSDDASRKQWMEAFNWEMWRAELDASTLERIFPGRMVVVYTRDLHSLCCSTTTLARAGINADTPDPPGGVIVRDAEGAPTGVLKEAAADMIHDLSSPQTEEDVGHSILAAQDYLVSLGLTAVSEVLDRDVEPVYRKLDAENRLKIDVDAWLRIDNWDGSSSPPDNGNRFYIDTLKVFLDGALGSNTASMQEPYDNSPDKSGVLFYTDNQLLETLQSAVEAGWRLAIHAIGDRSVEQICRILKQIPKRENRPNRIEHLQILPEGGIRLVVESEAVASVQPVHLIDDQHWLPERIGRQRCRRTSVWKSLFEAGVPLALGSDWPVASADPCLNIHAAVNRSRFGEQPHEYFDIDEALPPYLAVRAATYGWAYAAGLSERRGAIERGLSADLTILSGVSDDLQDWSKAKVEMTISRGEIIHSW